ncbi:MAG: CRISPR-associated endonuclease Cas1 [Blastocatellia bacterium]|nr:CRISPR-associated endonuclease Cas1 [Blastocatellia bacterium]
MATLYITEQGAMLRKEQNRLVVECDGAQLAEIHAFKVERVVIFGNAQLTTQVISFLLASGIDTAFLTQHGRLKGRLAPIASKNVPLRVQQYERTRDAGFALEMARRIVSAKISNCAQMLSRHQRNHPECDLSTETAQLARFGHRATQATAIGSLLGLEGQAAAVYFQGFARMLRRQLNFKKRTRRPPTDPVNSLLSFGYTLLYNEAISASVSAGFDPYLGFYHAVHYGRCSLALDLMEEMRPLTADRLALNLVNREIVKPEDFRKLDGCGVHLEERGRKSFLREYERMMNTEFTSYQTGERTSPRRALHNQALLLQQAIAHGTPYRAFQGWR